MSLRINYNSSAMRAVMAGDQATRGMSHSLERLSSGLRINRASDDAAGLSLSESLRAQLRGSYQAVRNAQDFISLVQTAEGALAEVTQLLQRVRELAVQGANGTLSTENRTALQAEVDQLIGEVTRLTGDTDFNGKALLDGTFSETAQVGAGAGQTLTISISDMSASALGLTGSGTVTTATLLSDLGITTGTVVFDQAPFLSATVTINAGDTLGDFFSNMTASTAAGVTGSISGNVITLHPSWIITSFGINGGSTSNFGAITNLSTGAFSAGPFPSTGTLTASASIVYSGGGISVSSIADASQTIATVDAALSTVSAERANLGASQNRLEYTIRNLTVAAENMAAAESLLRDLDYADEMTSFARKQILVESSTAILAQANLSSAGMLRLLA